MKYFTVNILSALVSISHNYPICETNLIQPTK
jgi:hypothetical protein